MNEMLASNENLIAKLQIESTTIGKRLESMAMDKQKYMGKVETILSE